MVRDRENEISDFALTYSGCTPYKLRNIFRLQFHLPYLWWSVWLIWIYTTIEKNKSTWLACKSHSRCLITDCTPRPTNYYWWIDLIMLMSNTGEMKNNIASLQTNYAMSYESQFANNIPWIIWHVNMLIAPLSIWTQVLFIV